MDARFDVLSQLNLRGMVAGSAIVDYHTASYLTPRQYVHEVQAGMRFDTNLSKQLHKGFRVHNVIPDYLPEDKDTMCYGVAIVWNNPNYREFAGLPRAIKQRNYNFALRPMH
jgi:hypothetical protein